MGQHFPRISNNENYPPEFLPIKERCESEMYDFAAPHAEPYNDPISLHELKGALMDSKLTAPGSDQIHYSMIKKLHISALNFFLLYNKIWTEGVYPTQWSRDTFLPLLKPNKPPTSLASYRPIALTSCLCKLLEKVVRARLTYYLEKNNILNPLQYGFRKMRGTEDVLIRLETAILNAFSRGKQLFGVFF